MKTTITLFTLVLSINIYSFEVDSFYKRNSQLQDASSAINNEVNARISKAMEYTTSCNPKEFFTNVKNQISADNSGFGVIGGMENWADKSGDIDKINPPPREQSVYYGTSFESITSMGFWLNLFQTAKSTVDQNIIKGQIAIRKVLENTEDPMTLCRVPEEQKENAKKLLEERKRPEGPPPGSMGEGSERPREFGQSFGPPPGGMPNGVRPSFNEDCSECVPPPTGVGQFKGDMNEVMDILKKLESEDFYNCLMTFKKEDGPKEGGNLQSVLNINGNRVGADKLGHFFDQGAEYFIKAYSLTDKGINELEDGELKALELGKSQEEGMFGFFATGIKSYGDMAANYGGMQFWKDLTLGNNPIAVCKDGHYELNKKFDINNYVTAAWDEGVNCSEYKSDEMKNKVNKNLGALNLSCPVEIAKCEDLGDKYSTLALDYLISPLCKSRIKKGSVVASINTIADASINKNQLKLLLQDPEIKKSIVEMANIRPREAGNFDENHRGPPRDINGDERPPEFRGEARRNPPSEEGALSMDQEDREDRNDSRRERRPSRGEMVRRNKPDEENSRDERPQERRSNNRPQMSMRQMNIPQMSMGQMNMPQMSMGQMNMPQMSMGQMSMPQMSMGQMNMPQMSMGQMNMPQMNMGQMNMRHMQRPQMGNQMNNFMGYGFGNLSGLFNGAGNNSQMNYNMYNGSNMMGFQQYNSFPAMMSYPSMNMNSLQPSYYNFNY